jgi:methylamine---glutamate N-methyltransferase subunit C
MTEFDTLGKARDERERRASQRGWRPGLRESALFDRNVIHEIQRAAREGIYDIRGFGANRAVPHFDDLLFLGASMSRYPLEGYRERCDTDVVLGDRHASRPLHLDIPITIAGMSFGALSGPAKEALGRGASQVGTSTTTGDGGMTPEEREHSSVLVYQLLPSRYGMNPDDLRRADAIEIVVGQGAKPGGGGVLLGQKISDRVAEMRDLPKGIDQRSACRHPDWTGPDDLEIKIHELREITDWEKPIFVKIGATRPYFDTALAVKSGADVVVLDGMQGGTAATQEVFIEHVGIPTLAAVRPAVDARHPVWRRRGEGAGARRRRGVDRRGGHRGAGGQLAGARGGVRGDCDLCRLLRRLARGSRPGGDLDPGRRPGRPLRPRTRGAAARELPAHHGARGADDRARVR